MSPSPSLFQTAFLRIAALSLAFFLSACATDSVVTPGMTPVERDRAIFSQFLTYSPQSTTDVEYLSFPADGRSGAYAVQDREFSNLRRDLSRIERMNLEPASPEVRAHIVNTLNLWRRIDSEQPRLRSIARTADSNQRSATQAGAHIGAEIGQGDPIAAGAGALLGQMAARAPMERIFEDHRRAYSGSLISLMAREVNLSNRLGIPVSPLLNQNMAHLQRQY